MSPVLDESEWDVVYSDGACKGNGQVGSVAGVGVWWGHDDPRNVAERCPGDQTNNRAELIAIVRVLETTPHSKKPLLIKTDSKYSIQCFEDWLPGWIRNGWRTSNNEPVKNVGVIKYLAALLDTRARRGQKVRLQYVKGHVGITGNEGADRQANLGAQDPPMKERDWAKLEVELRKCLENELRTADDKPDTVLPEVGSGEGTESPAKVRKITSTSKPTSSNSVVQPLKPSSRSAPQMSAVPVSPPPGVVHSPRSAAPPPTAADLDDYANCLLDDDDLAADLSD
ncbi:ribonuclease H-like domain-containing protein [Favolaschia claudopus]|uniref:ribonuclease H n=1 Tax=Favolaschia claudopus TaxID=2862362 RepID=A0AAW0EGL6_9AGAR